MLNDTFLILFISVFTAFLGEGLAYFSQSKEYEKLKADINRHTRKLEKKKEMPDLDKSHRKRLEKQEGKLKMTNRDLTLLKMKSMFAIGFVFTALLSMFNSIFDGRVVAKLPFEPINLIRGLSHRNIIGNDFTDCSFIFLYILCTMSIRQNVQKLLGLAPSRAVANQTPSLWFANPNFGK